MYVRIRTMIVEDIHKALERSGVFMACDISRNTDPTSDEADRDSILVGFKVGAGLTICMAQLLAIAGQSGHVR